MIQILLSRIFMVSVWVFGIPQGNLFKFGHLQVLGSRLNFSFV